MLVIEQSGKTIIEILGEGIIITLFGWAICFLFSLQGMMSGDKRQDVINTNNLHAKMVQSIDPMINKMDEWCEEQNVKILKQMRMALLNSEGLRYDDCLNSKSLLKTKFKTGK